MDMGRPRKFSSVVKRGVAWPEEIYAEAERRAKAKNLYGWTWSDQIRQDLAEKYGLVSGGNRPIHPQPKTPR